MDDRVILAYDYPVLGAFWTVMWIFLWVLWLLLLFRIIIDVFRDHEMSGWAKALWLIALIVFPFIGALVYVITRGRSMGEREIRHARAQQEEVDAYIRRTATGTPGAAAGGHVDDLSRLAELRDRGALSDDEYQRAKERILS